MKRYLSMVAFCALCSCSQIKPTSLRVDYVRIPEETLVRSESPIFSWIIDQESKLQSGYQIILSSDNGEVWNSGKVMSGNSHAVDYRGESLNPNQDYSYRVKYWDEKGRASRYSDIQRFRTSPSFGKSIVTENPLHKRRDWSTEFLKVDDEAYLFDFGRAAFGTLGLKFNAKTPMSLMVRVGEELTSSGRINRKPKGTIRYAEVRVDIEKGESLYDVLLPKDKRNTGRNAIAVPEAWGGVIMPFRYVEIEGVGSDSVDSLSVFRDVMYGYREDLGDFESSNKLLDSIWEISRYTIEATDFLGYYIDGDRERIPYEADAYINQLCHYSVDSEYAIAKRTLEHFMTNATWPTEWFLHTVMIAYQDYLYTGDKRLITKYYDLLKAKTLYELGREDGLISTHTSKLTFEYQRHVGFDNGKKKIADIVDWPKASFTKGVNEVGERDGHEMMAINTVVNAFHYQAVKYMSEIAKIVGRENDCIFFTDLARRVRSSINSKLFNAERGVYIDGEGSNHASLHSNMMPLAFGIVEPQNVKSVVEFVKSRGMACSVYGAQYLFEALYNGGESQYALDLMTNRSDRGWYNMIKVGSTMTLEAWDIKYKGNLDWNHAWGAAPANLIPRYMWGVKPITAGYKCAEMKPQLADLEYSNICVPTLYGVIKGKYSLIEGIKRYVIDDVPSNMTIEFECVEQDARITLNGVEMDGYRFELPCSECVIEIAE